jgi:glycosyltransferase involved in cell wall biosynthesis
MITSSSGEMRPTRFGFLIPEFPQQTHISWWRVSEGIRLAGIDVQLLSTRRSAEPCPHPQLRRAAERTIYLWPPSLEDLFVLLTVAPRLRAAARYLGLLKAYRGRQRLRTLAFAFAALRLLRISRLQQLDHIFVHSCADAAHVAALCRVLGGPPYSLRLGGDLEVYGGDHEAKMAGATLIVPAAQSYEPRLINEVAVAPKRVMWSWVGTDTDQFHPATNRIEDGPLRIITVARLNPAKGHEFMIRALALLRDRGLAFSYRIVGAGPFEPQIRKLLHELRLGRQVELLGSRSADEIAELLRESDLFVLPTSGIGEGTPAVVCEAMSAGLPVVATRVGGLADMITETVHGCLVPPGDARALADAVAFFAQDRKLALRMGSAARAKAVEQYDYRAVAKRILDKISQLTS